MTARVPFDWHDDRGQVAGIEALPFGLLLFVVGALLVANAWAVVDTKMAVTAAAREAARTYVEARDNESGLAAATQTAADVIRDYGRDPAKLDLPAPVAGAASGQGPFERCSRVTFTASYPVPALSLPVIGGFGSGFVVRASHSELVDPYRDLVGTAGRGADCAG